MVVAESAEEGRIIISIAEKLIRFLPAHAKASIPNAKRKRGEKGVDKEKPSIEITEAEAEKEAKKAWRNLDMKEKSVLMDICEIN